jgi:hypothetical protein
LYSSESEDHDQLLDKSLTLLRFTFCDSFDFSYCSGRMAKIPKETFRDTFEETNYYEIEFPEGASVNHKGLLTGASLLINAVYFENSE